MLGAVAAEIRERGKIHLIGNLGERQAFVTQIVFQYRHGVTVDVGGYAVARHTLDGGREVFGRNVQTLGLIAHVTLSATDASGK